MPHTPPGFVGGNPLDADAVRNWCGLALEALGRAREDIDAINVYPVADGDTGTNLYLTAESAARAVAAACDGHAAAPGAPGPSLGDAIRAMAHGALIGARGNSGTILAQLLRGLADVLAEPERDPAAPHGAGAEALQRALRHAAASAYSAVAHPAEGTVLTVAAAAADAAWQASGDVAAVARAAWEGARTALRATPEQLADLGRAGVVDAGGYGLVAVLGALVQALSGQAPPEPPAPGHGRLDRPVAAPVAEPGATACAVPAQHPHPGSAPQGPAFEVIYLLEAEAAAVERLRARLDALGDSLVVVGGDGLWNVHVHVDDAGAAVEAGIQAGRPYRIRITHFAADTARGPREAEQAAPERPATDRMGAPPGGSRGRAARAVVAVVPGDGLAALCAEAGATVVTARPGEPPASGELVEAVRRAHAREVVLLPNDDALRHTASAAAEQARGEGIRVALIPTRSAVQGIAALAVHEPARRFEEDVVAMTAAAGATRYAELAVAERESWTMAGVCQAGDVLGLIDGDVAVIHRDLAEAARAVLDRMLAAGGELVTLVLGAEVPDAVADLLEEHVRAGHLAVDTVVYRGGQQSAPLIIGVE
ncbi:dihydroxyacetone kinase [Streptomyces albus subsp. albus]|nr:dihydroxyacetone kinase [Streptomyces albus subsp. albus]